MGEMADLLIEQGMEQWLEDHYDGEPLASAFKTCRCCGQSGLEWNQRDGKWLLHDQRGIHVCLVNPLLSI